MADRFFEDFTIGDTMATGSATLDARQIVEFAREYDPQPFHLTEEAARKTQFGRLFASGWQTAAITMRLIIESGVFGKDGAIGLGVDGLRWLKPVFAGDELRAQTEVVEKRPSANKPAGTMHVRITTRNQHGEAVLSQTAIILLPMRGTA